MNNVTGASTAATIDRAVPARGLADALVLRLIVPLATMLTIGGLALLVLLTPLYIHPALDIAGAPAALGLTSELAYQYSDQTISDLVFRTGSFEFAGPDGGAFYSADERAHMRDVRTVLYAFLALACAAAIVLVVVRWRRRRDRAVMRAIGRGGLVLAIGTVVVGLVAAVAFDAAFELFHRLLFPGGNFTFDPATQRLVQLYPFAFWQLSAAALGVLLVLGGAAIWLLALLRTRAGRNR